MGEATSIWTVLLPVIIGGLIAAIGGAVGPALAHFFNFRTEERAKYEALFNEMINSLFQHDDWLDRKRNELVFAGPSEERYAPLRRAVFLSLLYFPEVLPALRQLDVRSGEYQVWMREAAQRRLSDKKNLTDGFADVYNAYAHAFRDAQDAVAAYVVARKAGRRNVKTR